MEERAFMSIDSSLLNPHLSEKELSHFTEEELVGVDWEDNLSPS